ncbi:hypothetical protein [Azospirillum sp. TSO5]|uniref:hypothetical protein n=1 Tax=Azospirillum sp. TSO5 TaxID=716760 RepID=UPI000D60E31B|nr:hypothetical protein [Azospirillum sp. TSO5]PWC96945.1 hypothetical protein TSO5_05805 [Azospirillum sp. TSO5]
MAETITPEQRALMAFPNGCIRGRTLKLTDAVMEDIRKATADAIRAAETAAVDRCVEALRDMGMHETALMLRVTMEADNAV